MKKIIFFVSLIFIFVIVGCGNVNKTGTSNNPDDYLYFYNEDNSLGFLKFENNELVSTISPQFDRDYLETRNQEYGDDYWYVDANKSLIPIKLQDKWGYIKKKKGGVFAIPPTYDFARKFYKNVAVVETNQGWTLIDNDGKRIINSYYDFIGKYKNNHAKCKIGSKYGIIDQTGKVKIKFLYDSLELMDNELIKAEKNDKYGYINYDGDVIVDISYDYIGTFHEGIARILLGNLWGFTKKEGIFINPKYDSISNFKNGIAIFKKDGKFGFIKKDGNIIVQPKYDEAKVFKNSIAPIKLNGKWGYLIKENSSDGIEISQLINPKYDMAYNFESKFAPVRVKNKFGIIDKNGDFIVEPQYPAIKSDYSEGILPIYQDRKWGYLDLNNNGDILVSPQFNKVWKFNNGLAKVQKGQYRGLINKNGSFVLEPNYKDIKISKSNVILALDKENNFFYFDKSGKYLYGPFKY